MKGISELDRMGVQRRAREKWPTPDPITSDLLNHLTERWREDEIWQVSDGLKSHVTRMHEMQRRLIELEVEATHARATLENARAKADAAEAVLLEKARELGR